MAEKTRLRRHLPHDEVSSRSSNACARRHRGGKQGRAVNIDKIDARTFRETEDAEHLAHDLLEASRAADVRSSKELTATGARVRTVSHGLHETVPAPAEPDEPAPPPPTRRRRRRRRLRSAEISRGPGASPTRPRTDRS